ncbi:aminoglycoside phosphotransferase family protein [Paractinoplanes rhizophilus]|uniref:Aminoglycoside phosphotransferase family protein n=1 Tax=Paractinoplanes rhizophilus TaxID=1416877 RepID=A0ABW2HY01_9ACTN
MTQATRVRIGWRDLPEAVRSRSEQIIGGRVVAAHSQPGGFSPGSADRVVTDSGRRAFVKAVTPAVNERSAELARQEMRITSAMPGDAPVPRMLGGFDDGQWVVLILEDIDGTHPRTPWVESEIDAAVTTLRELAAAVTPSPVPGVPSAADNLAGDFAGWDRIAADPPADLDPWAAGHLGELRAAAARGLAAAATGETLVHCDIRADNLLIRRDGRMMVVDWPWGCVGPEWFDRLLLGLDVLAKGGDPSRVFEGIDEGTVTDVIAAIAGMFEHICRQPPPPGIPTVRAFQKAGADAIRPWLRERL